MLEPLGPLDNIILILILTLIIEFSFDYCNNRISLASKHQIMPSLAVSAHETHSEPGSQSYSVSDLKLPKH